jgi:hypothetical protein
VSNLLVNGPSLIVSPLLAVKIGVNEALILQQVHYWLMRSKHLREDRKWVYNSYNDWQQQFPFMSVMTVKRTFWSLEKQGLLISANWNRMKMDKTKWYSINYQRVEAILAETTQSTNYNPV